MWISHKCEIGGSSFRINTKLAKEELLYIYIYVQKRTDSAKIGVNVEILYLTFIYYV